MPGRFFGGRSGFRRRGNRLGQVIDSMKNVVSNVTAGTAGTTVVVDIAKSVDAAALANATEVTRGCKIFKIWVELWYRQSETIIPGVTTVLDMYIWKNPGNNLTPPTPGTTGTSNEKKFVFKEFKGLTGVQTQGSEPYTWKGWLKIPKVYQRMGSDDQLEIVFAESGSDGILCSKFIYKWYK